MLRQYMQSAAAARGAAAAGHAASQSLAPDGSTNASSGGGGHGSGGGGGGGSGGGGGGGWALKESRHVFPTGQARPMSSRILAVGVMLVGVLVLSVALIMGLEFPKYVQSRLRDDQCVVHDQHDKFPSWRDGTQWTRQVRLYYHQIRNTEQFLYHGATPRFLERGPYIYKEYEIREDIDFRVSEVLYRISRHHEFDAGATLAECPFCGEHDMITVLNTEYLRRMFQKGGQSNYVLSTLPSVLQDILRLQGFAAAQTTQHAFHANISVLGCLDSVCDKDNNDTASPALVRSVSFGRWLRNAGRNYSHVILNSRSSVSFNASEIGAVYRVLLNSSVLGTDVFSSSFSSTSSSSSSSSSSSFSSTSSSGESTPHSLCLSWAESLCQGDHRTSTVSPVLNFDSSLCGVVHILQACEPSSVQLSVDVRTFLSSSFCSSHSDLWCLNLNSVDLTVFYAYFEAFRDFVLDHVLATLHDSIIAQRNQDIVVTRTQRELALGYNVTGSVDQSNVRVQGLLHEDWMKSPSSAGMVWRVNTCLKDRNMNNNMKVREFNGSQYAPQSLLRNPLFVVPVTGVTDFFAACAPTACVSCAAPGRNLHLFQPTLRRRLRFNGGDAASLWDTTVFRYWLSRDSFNWSNEYDVSCGLQKMTSTLGFEGWISLPKIDSHLLENVGRGWRNCSLPESLSYMDVEPVTGRVWHRTTQLQLNAGIRACDVTGPRLRPLNVTYLLKAVPVVWTERRMDLSGDELGLYDYKVDRLMKVSCGGVIGLSVVAVVVMVIGVVILVHPKKINRVVPALDADSSASNFNFRHLTAT